MRAFHGDDGLKQKLLERLEAEIARGAIERAPNVRFDDRGSIVNALLPGQDIQATAAAVGISEAVLSLLDHFGGHIYFGSVPVVPLIRNFMTACAVGALLDGVPLALAGRLRADAESHALVSTGASGSISGPAEVYDTSPAEDAAVFLDALAATPANATDWTGIVNQWLQWRGKANVRASGWSTALEAEAEAELQRLWDETVDDRRNGRWPDYPALFRASNPVLAAGYEHALTVHNEAHRQSAQQLVDWFLIEIAAAPVAGDDA